MKLISPKRILSAASGILFCAALIISVQTSFGQITPYQYGITKQATGKKGAVSSAHPLASQVGLSILQNGGNAFDAAIATQLALAVVYPGAGNIGGGGFLVAHTSQGKSIAIDYRERAPKAATREMYLRQRRQPPG